MLRYRIVWTHFCGNSQVYEYCTDVVVLDNYVVFEDKNRKQVKLVGGEMEITVMS